MKIQIKALAIPFSILLLVMAGCSSTADVEEEAPVQEASAPAPEAVEPEPVVQPEPEPEQITLESILYFEFDEATLRPDARRLLEAHAERMKDGSEMIQIEGYADERGTEEYNKALGMRRANAVRDFLVSHGVSISRIKTVSYGEANPQIAGNDEFAWQKNRRVELK